MRFAPESTDGANNGLDGARNALEPLKAGTGVCVYVSVSVCVVTDGANNELNGARNVLEPLRAGTGACISVLCMPAAVLSR
jgi:hypothetical protein